MTHERLRQESRDRRASHWSAAGCDRASLPRFRLCRGRSRRLQPRGGLSPNPASAVARAATRACCSNAASILNRPRFIIPPSAGQPVPTPQFPPHVTPTSIGTQHQGTYNAVEPWVQWGFELAAYARRLGSVRRMAVPANHDLLQLRRANRPQHHVQPRGLARRAHLLAQGLVNVGVDTINSFIFLANDQLAFWLPPLPPIPP